MGWTSYHATHYKKNGQIDRKAECDALFLEGEIGRHYEVLKSTMVGSIYYAAVRTLEKSVKQEDGSYRYEPLPKEEQPIFAAVILTQTKLRAYYNFFYKEMTEDCGPAEHSCPASILNLLSEPTTEYAREWRERCWKQIERKKEAKKLNRLPLGTKVKFTVHEEERIVVRSLLPGRKKKLWVDFENRVYFLPATIVEAGYEVVTGA